MVSRKSLAKAKERLLAAAPETEIRLVSTDLSTAEGCEALIQREPRCDVLVNNLGVFERKSFFETADANVTVRMHP